MRFNNHYNMEGKHAFMGASKPHWVNYDDEKLARVFQNQFASRRGQELHDIAAMLIKAKIRLPRNSITLNAYVNDAIGFRMTPEQVLFYSDNCFGTADAIAFEPDTLTLRIHDLKTGVHPGNILQLDIYAALFCVEYKLNPFNLKMLLRIYQMDNILKHSPDPAWIKEIMNKIEKNDSMIETMKEVMA